MSGFRFHDSLARETRAFDVPDDRHVSMYNCGPTVYSKVHLGNYRAYTCWDVLRRSLELGGYKVRQVVNITDVGHLTDDDVADSAGEDKLELAARREKLDAWGVAKKYTDYFFDVARKLNWKLATDPDTDHPRATAWVRNDRDPHDVHTMIGHVEELIRRGHAYATPAGNVYFEVATFPAYGRLSGNTIEQLVAGARVEVIAEKRHPADFALWKRDDKHQMQWDSPWGRGFPGWHIECSVMARALLGDTLDIHTGGEDHFFPHHECEIAQSEGVTGKPLANLWMHNRFLLVDGAKMSKSKGTMYVIEDIEARGIPPRALRYFLLATHYRAPMNFTWDALEAARRTVDEIDESVKKIKCEPDRPDRPEVTGLCSRIATGFLSALKDDLNVSSALSFVHELVSFINVQWPFSIGDQVRLQNCFTQIDSVLGLGPQRLVSIGGVATGGATVSATLSGVGSAATATSSPMSPDTDIERLIIERQSARKTRDFARADAIRKELDAMGIVLEDTPAGVRWYRR